MSDVVVKYRPRSVSKFIMAIFVVLLLVPMVIALISTAIQLVHGKEAGHLHRFIKTLLFTGGLFAIVFRPASKIMLDRQAGIVRYVKSWSTQAATEFPLSGLAAVFVEANPSGSLYRLALAYRDGSKRPLTDQFFYDEGHHQEVTRALNAEIGAQVATASRFAR